MTFEKLLEKHNLQKREITAAKKVIDLLVKESEQNYNQISNANDVFEVFLPFVLREPERENIFVMYLNRNNRILRTENLFKGGISASVIDLRLVYRTAILEGASSIIVGHNHPSGSLIPSASDISITKKLKEAGDILGIQLLDHLVMSTDNFHSMQGEGEI